MVDQESETKRFEDPELRERCRRFWHREETDRPLVGVLFNRMYPLGTFSTERSSSEVFPEDVTVEDFLEDCERRHKASEEIGGDAVFVAYPRIGMPWLEGIMGCEIRAEGGSAWSEPLPEDWKAYDVESIPWDNGWFDKLQELTDAAIQAGAGHYPVGPSHFRSPVDLASAVIGPEEFCVSTYEYPEALHRFVDVCTEVWLKAVRAQYDLLPTYEGGYWNGNQPLWTPGKTMFIPADVGSLISPQDFETFVMPSMRRILKGMDYSIWHTHSSYQHYRDFALQIEELRAIQVGLDETGPEVEALIPTFHKIQEQKALIVAVTVPDPEQAVAQARTVIQELSPQGLCILCYLPTVEAGKHFLVNFHLDIQKKDRQT